MENQKQQVLESLESQGVKFLCEPNRIYVAKKTARKIERYISIAELKTIDKDKQTAIDKCMLFISYLTPSFYESNKGGWRNLNSKILESSLGRYIPIKKVLIDNGIIQEDKRYSNTPNKDKAFSKGFKFTEPYYKGGDLGITTYTVKSKKMLKSVYGEHNKQIMKAINNDIGRNLLTTYTTITLPTIKNILIEGRKLIGTTRKGKVYKELGKHSKSEYSNLDKLRFIEDDIKLFERLTSNGFIIPIITGDRAGGRVIDSFNLMPKWIRKMVTFGNTASMESDYTCLHPNITCKLYGGSSKYLNHTSIAEELGNDRGTVKIEHLSFFNKDYQGMIKSPLWTYYNSNEMDMLGRVVAEKASKGYKVTSGKLFKEETKLMTESISILNSRGIYVLYIFDALVCSKEDYKEVKEVMEYVAVKNRVYTTVG